MCSNCSGDDLKPESFAAFDVSSPNTSAGFAGETGKKRKRYGTAHISAMLRKAALALVIVRSRLDRSLLGIVETVYPGSFVNLNLSASSGEVATKRSVTPAGRELMAIRVSSDAIIEVYSTADTRTDARSEYGLNDGQYLSAWEESYAERSDLQRTLDTFRRTRRLKYFMAYGAFAAAAALAVWCAIG